MKYTKLEDIQNPYPGNRVTVNNSYSTDSEEIKLTGKYPKNFLTFDIIKIDDSALGKINVDPDISIRFLVKFNDGDSDTSDDFWTSKEFLDDLRQSNLDSNPYFNRERVTVATVDFQTLREYWIKPKFVGKIGTKDVDGFGETYAEVKITETLDDKHEMLLHIDWMVSSKEELRPVPTFGAWDIVTTDKLGFSDEFFTGFTADNPFTPFVGGLNTDGVVPDGRGNTLRDGFPINLDDRVPGVDRNGNPVRVVTGSLVPDGRGDGRDGEPINLDDRTSSGDRSGTTVTTITGDGSSTRTGGFFSNLIRRVRG